MTRKEMVEWAQISVPNGNAFQDALLAALAELNSIGDALGTDETGDDLVEVARVAHQAEQIWADKTLADSERDNAKALLAKAERLTATETASGDTPTDDVPTELICPILTAGRLTRGNGDASIKCIRNFYACAWLTPDGCAVAAVARLTKGGA